MDDERLGIARGRLAKAAPYLATLFYRLTPEPRPGLLRPATDGARFLYDPRWLQSDADGRNTAAALAHATFHCLLGHPFGRWANADADMAVALLMDARLPEFCPFRGEGLYLEARRRLSGVPLDAVARAMAGEPFLLANRDALARLLSVDGHELWTPEVTPRVRAGGAGEDWQALRRANASLLRMGGGGRIGLEPGQETLPFQPGRTPARDYGALLRRYARTREDLREDPDEFQPGLYAHGLRLYGDMPLIEASETREARRLEELAVVIDTSGSCARTQTQRFLEETCALASDEALFFRRFNLRVLQCDAKVRRDDRITCTRDFERYIETLEIVGGGGTDFTPAFRRIDRLIERGDFRDLRCALIFTDGRGIFPTAAPAYDVVVVGIRGHFDGIDVPHWAGKLMLGSH